MADVEPHNHLNNSFYTTPKLARQVMSYKQWQETAKATQCKIIANGETYELKARHMGGGMYEVSADLMYWRHGKPIKVKS